MTTDSQSPSEQLRSALVEVFTNSISRAELRALRDGVGDCYHFLRPHKKRIVTYGLLLTFMFGIIMVGAHYSYWSLIRMVGRSSIVMVEVEHAPPDLTTPWQRVDSLVGCGTGSIIQGRRILTAAHIVADAAKITVTRADQNEAFEAELVAASHELDLAILTVRDDRFFDGATPLELKTLDHGNDELVAYGFPRGKLEYAVGWFKDAKRDAYVHSNLENLKYCVEAPIERGYSGGPVAWLGRIAGVIIERDKAGCYGNAVPAEVVRHFLKDIEDGRVDGSPVLFGSWQPMQNPQLRNRYGLTQNQTGVLVKQVLKADFDESCLRDGDVLLAVDGCDVDNDGTIAVVPDSRVSFEYLIDRKQVGDTVTVELLRDRRSMILDIPLSGLGKERMFLVRYQYDEAPSYLVVGGFVFSRLTRNYSFDYDDPSIEWPTNQHLFGLSSKLKTPGETRKEMIVLVRLLPDSSTTGYDDCLGHVVTSVDGRRVADMKELAAALENPIGEYHRILLEPDSKEIIVSRALLVKSQQSILEKFDIPADRSLDLGIAVSER
ncbi:MAG: trypsin-like peptidase domain-containing protein [Candidatus Krumholzibacteria bacterium]|nr:trypsin-like peptidase domain-containing protein [Candidatus Krumholzibacteria bacterium]